MKKYRKKMLKIIPLFIMFFTCINIVNAVGINKEIETTELYKKCDGTKDCLILCIYNDDTPDDQKYKNLNNSEKAYIGYYGWDGNGINTWEIGVIRPTAEKLYTFASPILPYTNIFWGGYSKNTNATWDKAAIEDGNILVKPYDKLNNSFECPKYINFDQSGWDAELCFSNVSGKCDDHTDGGTDFSKEKDNSLKYNFLEKELIPIINDTYNELYIFDSTTSAMINNPKKYPSDAETIGKLENAKIQFLSDVDPDLKKIYNPNKTAQENATNYCSILSEKLKDEKAYSETLYGKINDYTDMINEQLAKSATNYNAMNKNVFTLESLNSILTYRDSSGNLQQKLIKDPETNTKLLDKLDGIYSQNVDSSIKYITNICNNMTETNVEYDGETLREDLKDKFTTTLYEKIQLDTKTQFSCGTLGDLADLVKTGYFIIEMVALVILVVFTVLDYAKVILSGEQDEMKKTNKRLATRLIIMVVLLLLPALINFVLGVFNIEGFNSENPLCVEIKNK